jgi:hypothetical protein
MRATFVGFVTTIVTVISIVAAPFASAHISTGPYWNDADLTGFCGDVTSNYVVFAQSYLQSFGYYNYAIDGQFGQHSYDAIFNYQATHNLSADGCAGPNTWLKWYNNLSYGGETTCVPPNTNVYYDTWYKGLTYNPPRHVASFAERRDNSYWFDNETSEQIVSSSIGYGLYRMQTALGKTTDCVYP